MYPGLLPKSESEEKHPEKHSIEAKPKQENITDRYVSDFFHSKSLKIAATVIGSIFGGTCLVITVIFLLTGISFIAVLGHLFDGESNSPNGAGNPQIVSPQSAPALGWTWQAIDLYEMWVEIPLDWKFEEINRRSPSEVGIVTHDCADYQISSLDGNRVLTITMPCDAGDNGPNPCPDGTLWVDQSKGTVRIPVPDKNGYAYSTADWGPYPFDNGTQDTLVCWGVPAWFIGSDMLMAIYSELDKPFSDISDFEIPDRIVLSIHK
ncbi:MAG: hypothetical protein FD146_847 [Anaerolineaceae bacterium]|nr:MAG: hypothetical protein FD146_847 [Anaerolineaceae bacterium]